MKRLFLLCCIPVIAQAADPLQVEKPSFTPGEEWGYRRVDIWRNEEIERWQQTVTAVVGDHVTLTWHVVDSEDEKRKGSISDEFLNAHTQGFFDTRTLEGQHIPLSFPLFVGKTWSFTYKYDPEFNNIVVVHQKARVVGWETVRVPAGEYRALKVVHVARYNMTDDKHYWNGYTWSGDINEIYWYAPAARRVVKMEYSDTGYEPGLSDRRRDELMFDRIYPNAHDRYDHP